MNVAVKIAMKLALKLTLIAGGALWFGYVAYAAIMPVAATITQTLHDALLDNRGLHD